MSVNFQTKKLKPGKEFQEVLGLQNYHKFEHQIICGQPSRSLARQLQKEGYYTSIKMESLAQKIRDHRAQIILPKIKRFIDLESKTKVSKADKAIAEQRNVALELSNLFAMQKARLEIGLAKESIDNVIYGDVTKEMKLLKDILVNIGQFQIKSGQVNSNSNYNFSNSIEIHEADRHFQELMADVKKREQIAKASREAIKLLNEMDISEITS